VEYAFNAVFLSGYWRLLSVAMATNNSLSGNFLVAGGAASDLWKKVKDCNDHNKSTGNQWHSRSGNGTVIVVISRYYSNKSN